MSSEPEEISEGGSRPVPEKRPSPVGDILIVVVPIALIALTVWVLMSGNGSNAVDAEPSTAESGSDQSHPVLNAPSTSDPDVGEEQLGVGPELPVRQLAEQGDATAQFNLGVMYATGDGVPEDAAESVRWYRLAAEQGFAEAQEKLGDAYAMGRGVPVDAAESARLYRLAAEQGLATAQVGLGLKYILGYGVPQDYAEAYVWSILAAAQDSKWAEVRDIWGEPLSPGQLERAQQRARELHRKFSGSYD